MEHSMRLTSLGFAALMAFPAAAEPQITNMPTAQLDWQTTPEGVAFAALEGDRFSSAYMAMVRLPAGLISPPHIKSANMFGIVVTGRAVRLSAGDPAMMMKDQHTFKALADPTRREILRHLAKNDLTIAQVSDNFDMTRAAVKKHLTVLSDGGLITVRARGRERVNTLNPNGFAPIRDWLSFFDQFWDDRLSDLKTAIEEDHNND
ncbi:HTH-type transcriptional regulator [Nymphon striatum]|nr:HTH-type transcriptional regulator [Nymphon striatum]